MSQPESTSQDILPAWVDSTHISGMLRGIERESLRMQSSGFLSQADHPKALGSALTSAYYDGLLRSVNGIYYTA